MRRPSFVTLTTDFGLKDPYVAEMKGVILSGNPDVRFIDITHEIPPQDVLHASLVLWRSYRHFPPGTTHLAVVDPGVGTDRRILIVRTRAFCFVAPDNGLLSPILREETSARKYALIPARVRKAPSSRTFEGRDLMAPCVVRLSRGVLPGALGKRALTVKPLSEWRLSRGRGRLTGRILSQDRFGNLITSIREADYRHFVRQGRGRPVWVRSRKGVIKKLSRTYDEGTKGPIALFGSAGLLELALRNQSAAKRLALRRGSPVELLYGY